MKMNSLYEALWSASGGIGNLPTTLNILLPPSSCSANTFPSSTRPQASVLLTSAESSVLQDRGCGEPGLHLSLAVDEDTLEDVVMFTRFIFGVFPESGDPEDSRFPAFLSSRGQVITFRTPKQLFSQ